MMLMVADVVGQASAVLHPLAACANVPDPAPTDAGLPGATQFNTILGWIRWGALAAALSAVLISGGVMAFGHFTANQHAAIHGRSAVIWSVVGALIIGLGPVLIQGLYNMGTGATC